MLQWSVVAVATIPFIFFLVVLFGRTWQSGLVVKAGYYKTAFSYRVGSILGWCSHFSKLFDSVVGLFLWPGSVGRKLMMQIFGYRWVIWVRKTFRSMCDAPLTSW
jgi:hypothetical protein